MLNSPDIDITVIKIRIQCELIVKNDGRIVKSYCDDQTVVHQN